MFQNKIKLNLGNKFQFLPDKWFLFHLKKKKKKCSFSVFCVSFKKDSKNKISSTVSWQQASLEQAWISDLSRSVGDLDLEVF